MKYELWDVYETEVFDTEGEFICSSDSKAEIMDAAEQREQETDGECKLYVKEWI